MKTIIVMLLLSAFAVNAAPYAIVGAGTSSMDNRVLTVGMGVDVTDWLALEIDHRSFGQTTQVGMNLDVGPLVLNPGSNPSTYSCNPCHVENQAQDTKISGNVISAVFKTEDPRAFAFVRVGAFFRQVDTTLYHVNLYNAVDTTAYVPNPTRLSERSVKPIFGFGISAHGFALELTEYGNSYPDITATGKRHLSTSVITYTLNF